MKVPGGRMASRIGALTTVVQVVNVDDGRNVDKDRACVEECSRDVGSPWIQNDEAEDLLLDTSRHTSSVSKWGLSASRP